VIYITDGAGEERSFALNALRRTEGHKRDHRATLVFVDGTEWNLAGMTAGNIDRLIYMQDLSAFIFPYSKWIK
jgi:hypothetical protein